jgi:hypothetical protein
MKTHITKLLGLLTFIAIALGSATSSEVINAQNNLYAQGKWTLVAKGQERNLFYDPYSLVQTAPGVWQFMFITTLVSGQPGRLGPNQMTVYCDTNQHEELLLQANGVTTQSAGIKSTPAGSLIAEAKTVLCGNAAPQDNNNIYFFAASVSDNGHTNIGYMFIMGNEVNVDLTSGIRSLRVIVFYPDRKITNLYAVSADCSSKKVRQYDLVANKIASDWTSITGTDGATTSVLWDRACNDARTYMKKVSGGASTGGSVSSTGSLDAAKNKCTELGLKAGTETFGKCVLQMSR